MREWTDAGWCDMDKTHPTLRGIVQPGDAATGSQLE